MRVAVILGHKDQHGSAGVRVRYDRIAAHLARMGHSLDLMLIDDLLAHRAAESDIYLFCKCQDVRSILLAEALVARGRRVGVDIFDDYFSQTSDNRFTHLRDWLSRIARHVGFFLCATEAMQARLTAIFPRIPSLVMNDPFDGFDAETLAPTLGLRAARALRTREVPVAWFGMGDNPHFLVGLDDLCAMGERLAGFRRHGFAPRLHVLTNRRAMTPGRLARLARLPVPVHLEDWTTEREAALLRSVLVAFLPVNAQPFSTAKSLNRGVTALSHGAQVLSAGYPLYAPLDPFVYREVDELVSDLAGGRLRLAPGTLPALAARFDAIAAPQIEAGRLMEFLAALAVPKAVSHRRPVVVLHGAGNAALDHKFIQRSKMYSAAGPFQDARMHFDLRFEVHDGDAVVILAERMLPLLDPALVGRVQPHAVSGKITFVKLPLDGVNPFGPVAMGLADKLAGYTAGMEAAQGVIARLLPGVRIVLSESASPFRMRAVAPVAARGLADA